MDAFNSSEKKKEKKEKKILTFVALLGIASHRVALRQSVLLLLLPLLFKCHYHRRLVVVEEPFFRLSPPDAVGCGDVVLCGRASA